MEKAATIGDINSLHRAADKLRLMVDATRQEAANARTAWPFSPEQEESYLSTEYEGELLNVASAQGLQMQRQDTNLVAFPSVVRISPSDRAVKVDRRRISTVRPSYLVSVLKANQTKKSKFPSQRFLEALYRAYHLLVGKDGAGTTVALSDVYEAMTLLPGASSEYDRSDFGRDLFLLDRDGATQTRSGATATMPTSTGTKGSGKTFSFVAPDGEPVIYFGLRFVEPAQ